MGGTGPSDSRTYEERHKVKEPSAHAGESEWHDFFRKAGEKNREAMKNAGKDPDRPNNIETRKGQKMVQGRPTDGIFYCRGCDTVCPEKDRFECCQCLEIYRDRAKKAAYDTWERAYYCSEECYQNSFDDHRERHGPSTHGPTKHDPTIHEFEGAPGCGALWDCRRLKRINYPNCIPI